VHYVLQGRKKRQWKRSCKVCTGKK